MARAGETGCMGARVRMPLRVVLPCLAVSLAACGAAAIGMAGVSAASSDLMRQADDNLRACVSSMLSHGLVAAPGSGSVPGRVPPGACDIELLSASGQVLAPAAPGIAGPAIPARRWWLAAHLARPVTVPGAGTSGPWRVVIEAVRYQPQRILYVYGPDDVRYIISGPAGHGSGGLLAVMAALAGTRRLAAGYAATAGTVLVGLAAVALAGTQAILRPLRQAAELAEHAREAAGEGLACATPCVRADGNQNHWPFGVALARISGQQRASSTAEAAARRSAADMAGRLGEVALELRRSVNVVHGFAEYCRQRGNPPSADVDRMLQRVADEVTRMETLLDRLDARSTARPRNGRLGSRI